jgi:hypothetical protein
MYEFIYLDNSLETVVMIALLQNQVLAKFRRTSCRMMATYIVPEGCCFTDVSRFLEDSGEPMLDLSSLYNSGEPVVGSRYLHDSGEPVVELGYLYNSGEPQNTKAELLRLLIINYEKQITYSKQLSQSLHHFVVLTAQSTFH